MNRDDYTKIVDDKMSIISIIENHPHNIYDNLMITRDSMVDFYQNIIPGFYKKSAEGNNIIKLYDDLSNPMKGNLSITIIDLNQKLFAYKDYISAMYDSIIQLLSGTGDNTELRDYISVVKKKDQMYRDKLFNESPITITVQEAMINLEAMIDLRDFIKSEVDKIDILKEQISAVKTDEPIVPVLINTFMESNILFISDFVKKSIGTYYEIYGLVYNIPTETNNNTEYVLI